MAGHTSFLIYLLTIILIAAATTTLLIVLYHCMTVSWFNNRTTSSSYTTSHSYHWRRTPFVRPGAGGGGGEDSPSIITENSVDELIPIHKYQKGQGRGSHRRPGGGDDDNDGMCTICLCEFEGREELRTIPECVYSFHVACIDMWLYSHSTCLLCRIDATLLASPLPSPQYMLRPFLDSSLEGSTTTT